MPKQLDTIYQLIEHFLRELDNSMNQEADSVLFNDTTLVNDNSFIVSMKEELSKVENEEIANLLKEKLAQFEGKTKLFDKQSTLLEMESIINQYNKDLNNETPVIDETPSEKEVTFEEWEKRYNDLDKKIDAVFESFSKTSDVNVDRHIEKLETELKSLDKIKDADLIKEYEGQIETAKLSKVSTDDLFKTISQESKAVSDFVFAKNLEKRKIEREMAALRDEMKINTEEYFQLNSKYNALDRTLKSIKEYDFASKYEELKKKVYNYIDNNKVNINSSSNSNVNNNSISDTNSNPNPDPETKEEEKGENKPKPVSDDSFAGMFESLKNSIDESLPDDVINNIVKNLNDIMDKIYSEDQEKFERALKDAKTVEEKIKVIDNRIEEIKAYKDLYTSTNAKVNEILTNEYNKIGQDIEEKFAKSKLNGEYCFKKYEAIKESINYIKENVKTDPTIDLQFDILMEDLDDLLDNDLATDDMWLEKYDMFAEGFGLDKGKLNPYVNARIKLKHPDLDLSNLKVNKNTKGDNLDNDEPSEDEEKENTDDKKNKDEIPKKKRRKVIKKEKKGMKEWFKKHPKAKWVALGLTLAAAGLPALAIPVMMTSSALWGVLGGSGPICSALHTMNMALSKVAAFGAFKFVPETGLYTLGGAAGAKALYTAAGAKLLTAAEAVVGAGGIGAVVVNKVKKLINKVKDGKSKEDEEPIEAEVLESTPELEEANEPLELAEPEVKEDSKAPDVIDESEEEISKEEEQFIPPYGEEEPIQKDAMYSEGEVVDKVAKKFMSMGQPEEKAYEMAQQIAANGMKVPQADNSLDMPTKHL